MKQNGRGKPEAACAEQSEKEKLCPELSLVPVLTPCRDRG